VGHGAAAAAPRAGEGWRGLAATATDDPAAAARRDVATAKEMRNRRMLPCFTVAARRPSGHAPREPGSLAPAARVDGVRALLYNALASVDLARGDERPADIRRSQRHR